MMLPAALVSSILLVQDAPIPDASVGTTRGITGTVSVQVDEGVLRARPDLALDDALLVRIAAVRDLPDGGAIFDLEYMGTTAGVHDLRDVLVFADGTPIETLPPIEVQIASHLGIDSPVDLDMTATPPAALRGGYLFWLTVAGIMWLAIPACVIARRMSRRPAREAPPPPPPTLADQLRPLVRNAAAGTLDVDAQARLELLLHKHWQRELALDMKPHEVLAALRTHETAGPLVRAIEGWLHDPHGSDPSPEEISALLAPYDSTPAQDAP